MDTACNGRGLSVSIAGIMRENYARISTSAFAFPGVLCYWLRSPEQLVPCQTRLIFRCEFLVPIFVRKICLCGLGRAQNQGVCN